MIEFLTSFPPQKKKKIVIGFAAFFGSFWRMIIWHSVPLRVPEKVDPDKWSALQKILF